jgi:benzoylformate decarboxylase
MYSVQALWTAAHYALPILFVILANRQYRVLKLNMDTYRRRFDVSVDRPYPHMDLAAPDLSFTDLARGMGVPGISVDSAEALREGLADALKTSGPFVIEISVE